MHEGIDNLLKLLLMILCIRNTTGMAIQSLEIHRGRTRRLLDLLFAQRLMDDRTLFVDFAVHDVLSVIRQRRDH